MVIDVAVRSRYAKEVGERFEMDLVFSCFRGAVR